MVLPIIGVTLPPTASVAEGRTLIEACDQAFQVGDCVQADPEETASSELVAVVEWITETEAHVVVRRVADDNSDQEIVSFVSADEVLERYRTLGFAIGSLASAFVTSDDDATTEPRATAPPLDVPVPEVREPKEPLPEWDEPPPPVDPTPLPAPLRRNYVEAGALIGNGFQNPRFGGGVSVWLHAYGRWASELSVGVATQSTTTDGIGLSFYNAEAAFGPRFELARTLLSPSLGVQAQHVSGTLGQSRAGRPRLATGPLVALHARATSAMVAPFVAARLSWLSITDIAIVEADGDAGGSASRVLGAYGPLQFEARLGLSIALGQ